MMVGAIAALMAISLFVLSEVPFDSEDSTEQMMSYVSLVLFMMALALVGALALVIPRKGNAATKAKNASDKADEDFDDGASDIELEFRALEREIDSEEKS